MGERSDGDVVTTVGSGDYKASGHEGSQFALSSALRNTGLVDRPYSDLPRELLAFLHVSGSAGGARTRYLSCCERSERDGYVPGTDPPSAQEDCSASSVAVRSRLESTPEAAAPPATSSAVSPILVASFSLELLDSGLRLDDIGTRSPSAPILGASHKLQSCQWTSCLHPDRHFDSATIYETVLSHCRQPPIAVLFGRLDETGVKVATRKTRWSDGQNFYLWSRT